MRNLNQTPHPALSGTIAVRLSEDECRALAEIAHRSDRTISYVVRSHLRAVLTQPQATASSVPPRKLCTTL